MPYLSESERAWWIRHGDYEDEDPLAHEKLHAVINTIERNQDRKRDLLLFGSMYGGGIPPAGGGTQVDQYIRTTPGVGGSSLSLNVSRSVTDAAVSRLFSKAKPHLTYATEGGGPEKQHNAQQLERGVAGTFYQEGAYDRFVDAGRDGCVFGTGFTRIWPDQDDKCVRFDRYMPWEAILDDGEVLLGEPYSFYSARYWDKYVLLDRIRKGLMANGDEDDLARKAALVAQLTGQKDQDAEFGFQQVALRTRVEEAWRRPSGRDGTGECAGRHVIGVGNCTLVDEPWDGGPKRRPWQFAWYYWSKPIVGFYGQGIVELGAPLQSEINKIVKAIQNGMHLINGKWLVHQNSKIVAAHINNDLSSILRYSGDPSMKPEYIVPAIIAPEVYSHLWALVAQYKERAGFNEQALSGAVPERVHSGEGQRVAAQQQTETLLEKGARYEEYVKLCGQLAVDAARELAKTGAYEVRAWADDGFETIDWKELEDPDGYELRVAPTSSLPGTPEGKIDLGYDLMQIGDVDAADVMELIGMKDILQLTGRKQASRKLVEKRVGEMLRDGTPYEPHKLLNLDEAIIIATQLCNLAELKDVPDDRLDLVRQFIAKCAKRKSEQMPPPAPPVVAPGAAHPMLGPGQMGAPIGPAAAMRPPMGPMNGAGGGGGAGPS